MDNLTYGNYMAFLVMVVLCITAILIMNAENHERKKKINQYTNGKIIVNTDDKSEFYLTIGKIVDKKKSEINDIEIHIEYKNNKYEIYSLEYALDNIKVL